MKARTTTCGLHRHPEFVLEYDPSVAIEADIEWLVTFLERSVASGTSYKPQETVRVGWTDIAIEEAEAGYLKLLEPDWTGSLPVKYIAGVTRTLTQLRRQKDVAESLDLGDRLSFPTIWQSGIICNQAAVRGCGFMERAKPEGQDSGWFLGCDDPGHDHNDGGVLKRTSLYEIGCLLPGVVQFCALPSGFSLSLGGAEKIVAHIDGHGVRIRKGSYLEELIKTRPMAS